MSNDDKRYTDDGVDEPVSAAYRQLATETTPPDLDAIVLAEARRPVPAERTGFARWRRPLAWATMIALSFAIVLEFNETGTLPDAEYVEPARQGASDGLSETSPPATPGMQVPEAGTVSGFTAFDRDESLETLSEEAAQNDKRARDEELSTMSAPQGAIRTESASPLAADADTMSYLVPPSDNDDGACSAEARSDPARWRDCIEELMAGGRSSDVRAELAYYRETFPDEPMPDLAQ